MSTEQTRTENQATVGHWKLRRFYYNPNDAALFVRKRTGVGHTVNLANPRAWFFLAALVALIVSYINMQ